MKNHELQKVLKTCGYPHQSSFKNDFTMNQSDNGKRQVIRMIVRDQLFRRMKFANKHELQYSRDSGTICNFVMTRLNATYDDHTLQEQIEFWNEYKSVVMAKLTQQRNNCIQSINNVTKGKPSAFLCDRHLHSFAHHLSRLIKHYWLSATQMTSL